jgi:hypothetical protein
MRRLPVLQETESDDALAASRPRWQWTLIGAGLTVTLWVPLVLLTTPIVVALAVRVFGPSPSSEASPGRGAGQHGDALAAALAALSMFAVAAFVAGSLVGRFGGRSGMREAAVGAGLAAAIAAGLSLLVGRGIPWQLVAAAFACLAAGGTIAAALGARFGLRRRPVLDSATR